MTSKFGTKKLYLAAKIQIMHKQLLTVLIKLAQLGDLWPLDHQDGAGGSNNLDVKETPSRNDESVTVASSSALTERPMHAAAELFCSYQNERLLPRAKYLEYISSVSENAPIEKVRVEALEKLAGEIKMLNDELCQRYEIITSYSKIVFLIQSYPNLLSNHFELGASLRYEPEQPDLLAQGTGLRIRTLQGFEQSYYSEAPSYRWFVQFGESRNSDP